MLFLKGTHETTKKSSTIAAAAENLPFPPVQHILHLKQNLRPNTPAGTLVFKPNVKILVLC